MHAQSRPPRQGARDDIQFLADKERRSPELPESAQGDDLRQRVEALYEAGYTVGPYDRWFAVRQQALDLLTQAGLRRDSVVLDLGCGMLRLGSALIPNLERGCYLGIEPDEELLRAGIEHLVGDDVIRRQKPRFYHGTDFRLSTFDTKVDYVIARSVWSHASRDMIRTTLDEFVKVAHDDSVLLASFYEARLWPRHRWPYYGKKWLYPNITKRGGSYHFKSWLNRECRRRGLQLTIRDDEEKLGRQTWAQVTPG